MIKSAKRNGAGLVKFQLFDASKERESPYFNWLNTHELTFGQAKMLFDYGQEVGLEVFFSVFEAKYVEWCERIGVKRYKVASAWARVPLEVGDIISTGKPIIMSILDETVPNISEQQLESMEGRSSWLYCPAGYPQEVIEVPYFHQRDCPYDGYSDHTIGLDIAKLALARGAQIIEKHFVMEPFMDVPDAEWSMTPEELLELAEWEKLCELN